MGAIPGGEIMLPIKRNKIMSSLKNFVQCPNIECNGDLDVELSKNQPLVTERIIVIECLRCQDVCKIIITPDMVEEE